ncbi:MAG: DUF2670 domain-containing protein [Rickettsia sp.]|nr:DUF2670 domain-containing protein [Rickettsia sp.]
MVLFIYGIISKWYILVFVSTIAVTFWVFKGLNDLGLLDKFTAILVKNFTIVKSVAKNCTPLITKPDALWGCLGNPGVYEASKDEQDLEKTLTKGLVPKDTNVESQKKLERNHKNNPYASE